MTDEELALDPEAELVKLQHKYFNSASRPPGRSEELLDYAESLTVIEGYESKPVQLYGCQCFDLGVPMGWVNRERFRRFRRKYKSVARQNGKTFENGITGSYLAAFAGYRFGKLFTVATSKKQAKLVWTEIQKFTLADEDLQDYFDIKEYKYLITEINTLCTIEALSKEAGLEDGERSIYASIDEIHQLKDMGIVSGLAATGVNQISKQLGGKTE